MKASTSPSFCLLPARVTRGNAAPRSKLQTFGDLGDTRPSRSLAHAAEVRDDLAPAHAAELWKLTGQVADLAFHRNGIAVAVEPENGPPSLPIHG